MAGPIASLFVKLGLDAREFTQGINTAQTSVAGFTKSAGSRFSQFGANVKQGIGLAFGIGTVSLIRDGVDFLVGGINDSIDAFKQQEIATARLTTSLDANVPGWQKYQGAIDAAMKSTISLGFQDDDFALGLSRVVAATHDVQKGLEVMAVAQDLARFKGISLTDAAEALTKVEAGRFRMLADLGIQLPKNATEEQALAAVRKAAAGQAAAYTDTLAGKEEVLNAKLNEQQELLGQKLAPAQLAVNQLQIDLIKSSGDWFDLIDSGNKSASEQVDIMNSAIGDVKEFFPQLNFLTDALTGNVQALKDTSDETDFFARHLTDASDAVGLVAQDVKDAQPLMTQSFASIFDGAAAAAEKDLQAFRDIGAGVPTDIVKGMQATESMLTSGISDLKDLIKNGLTPDDLATTAAGAKTIKLFQQGMNSEVIRAKEQAEAVAGASIKALVDAADNGVLGGKDAKAAGAYLGGLFNAGLTSQEVDAILAGAGMSAAAIQAIHDQFPQFFKTGAGAGGKVDSGFLSTDHTGTGDTAAGDIKSGLADNPWFRWGKNVSQTWIDGFTKALRSGKGDIRDALVNATGGMIAFSPPKEGPLTEIDKWGFNMGRTWTDAMAVGISGGVTGINRSMSGLQLATARVGSLGVSAPGLAVAASRVGGITNNFYGPVYGGAAGLRQLDQDIRNATRQAVRGAGYEVGR